MEKVFRYASKHPLRVLAATAGFLLLVLLLSLFVGGDSKNKKQSSNPPAAEQTTEPNNTSTSGVPPEDFNEYQQFQESRDQYPKTAGEFHSETRIKETRQRTNSQQGLYDLPYRGRSIRASYVRVLPDGRYLIQVRYTSTLSVARREWLQYLAKRKDSGASYLVVYKKA